MLHWLQKKLVSDETADWIDECAVWVIQQFDSDAFWHKTQLILPNATYFPETVSGPVPMARYVLQRVTELAGIDHWPWQLVDIRSASPALPKPLPLNTHHRFITPPQSSLEIPQPETLPIPFVIDQVSKPQDLTATIAHTCAQHLIWQSQLSPPGGMSHFEQAAEVLAVFSGFGLMLTNTAYTYRGSCARCYNPRANRQASLSEAESIYVLALFCHLKKIPKKQVFQFLKPYLKNSYKVALKQINLRPALPITATR